MVGLSFVSVDIVLKIIGCCGLGCGMSKRIQLNDRFLVVHKRSVVDAISVDREEGRMRGCCEEAVLEIVAESVTWGLGAFSELIWPWS